MNYREILKKSYDLTINNPILWIFGLFLSAGFNLNVLYIGAVGWDKPNEILQVLAELFRLGPIMTVSSGMVAVVVVFLISTYVKTMFVTEAHQRLHDTSKKQCHLCVTQEHQVTLKQRLPRSYSVWKIAIASVVTIAITVVAVGLLNYVIGQSAIGRTPAVISLSALATAVMVCGIGCWNVFTVLFILWHSRSFAQAASASLDLISLRSKQVTEFIVVLVVVYGAAVVIGSVLVILSQFSLTALFAPLQHSAVPDLLFGAIRITALIFFWIWLSITNVFFNICLFVFFDELVKPVKDEDAVPAIGAFPSIAE